MKGRNTYILGFLLLILVLFAGCTSKPLKEPTGPKWDTVLTVPLVMRVGDDKIMFDDLEGESLHSITFPREGDDPMEASIKLNPVKIELAPIEGISATSTDFDLSEIQLPEDFQVDITVLPEERRTVKVDLTETGFISATMSSTNDEFTNRISIELSGGHAGENGLTFLLKDQGGTPIAECPIEPGDTSGNLDLSHKTLVNNMTITAEGQFVFPAGSVPSFGVSFGGTTLEVVEVVIDRDSFDDLMAETSIEDINIEEEFDEDFPNITFKVVDFVIETVLPENLQFKAHLDINNEIEVIDLTGTAQTKLELADTLNNVFTKPDKLNISLITNGNGLGLSAADNVTLNMQENYKVGMKITAGFETIYSRPEEIEVPEDLKDTPDILQEVAIDFLITNNSPADLTLTVLLSPEKSVDNNGKLNDLATKEFQMRVKAGSLLNPETTESTLKISHNDFKEIFGDFKNEYFYSQILVANDSEEGKFTSDHYLEIQSRAHVKVRIDPEKMRERSDE